MLSFICLRNNSNISSHGNRPLTGFHRVFTSLIKSRYQWKHKHCELCDTDTQTHTHTSIVRPHSTRGRRAHTGRHTFVHSFCCVNSASPRAHGTIKVRQNCTHNITNSLSAVRRYVIVIRTAQIARYQTYIHTGAKRAPHFWIASHQ